MILRPVHRALHRFAWDAGPVKIAGTVKEGDDVAGFKVIELPGHAPGEVSRLIARWYPLALPDDGVAAVLEADHSARISMRYELPQGRRYALLSAAPR